MGPRSDHGPRKLTAGPASVGEGMRRLSVGARRIGEAVESGCPGGGAGFETGDLFAWGARQKRYRSTGSISVRPTNGSAGRYTFQRPREVLRRQHDRRFVSYLYSGSFGGASLSPTGRSVRRNRAIFLLIVGLLVTFVACRLMVG